MTKAIEGEPQSDTETDIAVGVMATQGAMFGKNRMRDDEELKKYRRRMNAVLDAQANRFGAELPDDEPEGEDMRVYTNSPIVHTTRAAGAPAWLMTAVGAGVLAGGVWLGHLLLRPETPEPPDPPPVSASEGDLHIKVIRPGE